MTVISQDSVATFEGNGIATDFPFGFRFFKDSDLTLTITDPEGNSEQLTTGYTIHGAGNEEGGIAVLVDALQSGYELRVERVLLINQMTDLRNQGRFFAEVHEDTFDRIVMLIQQAFASINQVFINLRSTVRAPGRETIKPMPKASDRSGKLLSFDSAGNPVTVAPVSESATELAMRLADAANPALGAALIGRGVIAVDSIDELLALPESARRTDLRYAVKSYHSYSVAPYSGGGDFAYSPDTPKSRHNGGTVLSTTVPWSPSIDDYLGGIGETDATGSGCWVRTLGGTSRYEVADFGWRAGVDLLPVLNAIKVASPIQGAVITLPVGILHLGGTFTIDKGISLVGAGTGQGAGAGPYTTIVKAAEIDGPAITVSYPQVSLRDFALTGADGNAGIGLLVLNRSVILDNLTVSRMGSHGIRLGDDGVYQNCNLFKFNDLKVKDNGGFGIYLHQPIPDRPTVAECNVGVVSNCDVSGNAYSGISVRAAAANLFLNNTCQFNGEHGIFIWADGRAHANVITGGDYEVNGRNGEPLSSFADIKVSAGSRKTRIIAVESYNDPISAEIDEPTTLVLGLSSSSAGYTQNEYMGLHLPNLVSANPRVLDWYEEGGFNATVVGMTSAGLGTYTQQVGRFTRIGNRVHFAINLTWTGHTGTGGMQVQGLPYSAKGSPGFSPISVVSSGLTKPADSQVVAMVSGFVIAVYSSPTGSTMTTTVPLAMDTSATMYLSGSYEVV